VKPTSDRDDANDLPGPQDMGGRHGGQHGQPRPVAPPAQQEEEVSPTGQEAGDPVLRRR
jgi:hypothetical protein